MKKYLRGIITNIAGKGKIMPKILAQKLESSISEFYLTHAIRGPLK